MIMGIPLSCPGADALDEGLEALFMRSLSFGGNAKSALRSFSFNGRDAEPTIFKAFGSGKLILRGSFSFKGKEMDPFRMDAKISINKSQALKKSRFCQPQEAVAVNNISPKHEAAALKLQKVYKGFRTRRQLADCAVLVEQRWWKLLDFALLKRSSVSFFDIEKPESAVSRWSRARTRAAKVGKGLLKDVKAQKLALQHWLEAIDPRHRYGHNLHFYYDCWLNCESKQPFFYWLDVGEGKEVNIEDKCPRAKLQQQCIKYLGPKEREAHEVIVEDGKFYYRKEKKLLDTTESTKGTKWIFVLSTSRNLYVGQKKKGFFQHSSFLAGGATSAAGRLVVENGILKAVWPHSGHYRPTQANFQDFMSFLKENNVDLTDVQESPTDEDEETNIKLRSNITPETNPSDPKVSKINTPDNRVSEVGTSNTSSSEVITSHSKIAKFRKSLLARKTLAITIPPIKSVYPEIDDNKENLQNEEEESDEEMIFKTPHSYFATDCTNSMKYSSSSESLSKEGDDDFSDSEEPCKFKKNLFVEEPDEVEERTVAQELILRRMKSKKGLKSLQLGTQLSSKWTTGAGPRIGFVRDYPSELQFRALEQMNLSPKGCRPLRLYASPKTGEAYLSKEDITHHQQERPNSQR